MNGHHLIVGKPGSAPGFVAKCRLAASIEIVAEHVTSHGRITRCTARISPHPVSLTRPVMSSVYLDRIENLGPGTDMANHLLGQLLLVIRTDPTGNQDGFTFLFNLQVAQSGDGTLLHR